MRSRLLPLAFACVVGCNTTTVTDDDDSPADTGTTPVDTGTNTTPDSGQIVNEDAGNAGPTIISGGAVSGAWCGRYEVTGNITVPDGQTLTICGGSEIGFGTGVGFEVIGTLTASGESSAIRFYPLVVSWGGITVSGTLHAVGIDISGGSSCLVGRAASSIDVDRAVLSCNVSLRLGNGGLFRHVTVNGGSTVEISGGNFDIADSTIDLNHPEAAPDCTDWSGGSATIDHVRFTGCHCPLHWNSASGPISVTNSIFDGASIPVMIASATATFRHNHFVFLGTGPHFLDIGGPFTADIAGNYWGGVAPYTLSNDQTQFIGGNDYSTTPFDDVGPR